MQNKQLKRFSLHVHSFPLTEPSHGVKKETSEMMNDTLILSFLKCPVLLARNMIDSANTNASLC